MTGHLGRWRADLALLFGTLAHLLTARLTGLAGRDETLWLFGARFGEDYADNTRFLFEYATDHAEVRAVWLSTDPATVASVRGRGHEAYHARSLRGRWLALRAGCVLVTHSLRDVSLPLTGGAFVANLWHGVPIKTVGFDAELGERPWPVRTLHRRLAEAVDFVCCPSSVAVHPTATGLGVPHERIHCLPYPRWDPLVGDSASEDLTSDDPASEDEREDENDDPTRDGSGDQDSTLAHDGPVVCYLPTFREAGADLADRVDVTALDDVLAAHDARLVVKAHPYERFTPPEGHPRITALDTDDDLSTVLRRVDVLVTDYSSVCFDFLLLDRPVVFFAPDLDRYRAERGFYVDYESFVPGPVARDDETLRGTLDRTLTTDPDADRRRAFADTVLADTGTRPSERVFTALAGALDSTR